MAKKKAEITVRSSAAEYLTFIAASGDNPESIEVRYEDENIWLTQKMMATLYGVTVPAMADWEERLNRFLTLWDHDILQDKGRVTHEIAKALSETEFEQYRVIQDKIYKSDFDKLMEESARLGEI